MCECKLILFGAFVLCSAIFVTPFNIDNSNYAVYTRESSSMFGFTVAVHRDKRDIGWVLVGAPEAQSDFQDRNLVSKGGAVYSCRTDADNYCQEIPFNRASYSEFGNRLDDKSRQWFGATLGTSGQTDGPIVACAPRYVWFTRDLNRRDPVGTCFVADGDFNNTEEYSPCRTMNWGYHRQGSCQAGFSAAINRDGDRLYVGAPGSYYWQGQLYSIDAHATFNFTPGIYGNKGYGAKGSVHQQHLETRPAVFSTREGKPVDDDSYMGYSMVVGRFDEREEYEGIAVGMPRGNALKGKVLLFTWDLKNYKNITTVSKQIGSYFGYSITAADVNGDKRLDIIVGAPMHTEKNNDLKYDVGRVYIFYQGSNFAESFNTFHSIDGINSKSRFGHSVSTLGDLNLDGFDDFAVGAPYAGEDGRGAVYIYYGSAEGKPKEFKQVIYAKEVESSIPTSAFGFSIAGGLDLNGDDYPDMAVGAYLSNSAFFFRSRPVVSVNAYVEFKTTNKQIDIKQKCKLPNNVEAPCTDVQFCMNYTGTGIPQSLRFKVEYILDSKKPENASRMKFAREGKDSSRFNDIVLLYKDRPKSCISERVYIANGNIRDKLTPLEAEMKYSLIQGYQESTTRNPRSVLRPVLDLNSPPSRKDSITVQKNCGPDNICIPDLQINVVPNVKEYVLDSGNKLELDVVVSNLGEDSFETTFYLHLPKGIYYSNPVTSQMSGIICNTLNDTNLVKCDIGNPLPGGNIAAFKIVLQPDYQEEMKTHYVFDALVNSTNPEPNYSLENNRKRFAVKISINASLELTGYSKPSTVYYNSSSYTSQSIIRENDIGPQVTHVFYVTNIGTATIPEAEVFIAWPQQTSNGKDLLYQLEKPHTHGNVVCDSGNPNYKNYEINWYKDSIWKRLSIDLHNNENITKAVEEKFESKAIETGKGVASGVGVINRNGAEENDSSSGDSSIHTQHRQASHINSNGVINSNGESIMTKTEWRTITGADGVQRTVWRNVTTVRDSKGKIINTTYSNEFYGNADELGSAQSYFNSGGGREYQSSQYGSQNAFGQDGSDFTNARQNVNQGEEHRMGQQNIRYNQEGGQRYGGRQDGVYESTRQGQRTGQRIRTGYYDQQGNYQDIPHSSGHIVYNRTETVEHSIPIDIQAGKNEYYSEVTPTYTVQTYSLDGASEEPALYGAQSRGFHGAGSSVRYSEQQYSLKQPSSHQERSYSTQWQSQGGYSQQDQIPLNHNSVERDNVPTDSPSPNNRYRHKRMVVDNNYPEIRESVGCTNCQYMRCVVTGLRKNAKVTIALRSRLNVREINNLTSTQPIKISSVITGRITKLPRGGTPKDRILEKYEIITNVPAQQIELVPDVAPLWIYVVSAVIGVVIVLLLMWLLNKCGFFRRNRPSSGPERQPLNRNGYHSGDEAL